MTGPSANPNPFQPGKLDPNRYLTLWTFLGGVVEFKEELDWARAIEPPATAEDFALEAIFVVLASGFKAQTAQAIYKKVANRLQEGPVTGAKVFGHQGKCGAIDRIWEGREDLFKAYQALDTDSRRLAFLQTIPYVGPITRYHLAKNFGLQVMKPDRWIARIAYVHGASPDDFCNYLARTAAHPLPLVDMVLWRCANLGAFEVTDTAIRPVHPWLVENWDLWYFCEAYEPPPVTPGYFKNGQPYPPKPRGRRCTPCGQGPGTGV